MMIKSKNGKINRRRAMALAALLMFVFSAFALRLFQIQIVEGEEYAGIANQSTSTTITLAASRGEILDRNLNPLASNRTSFSVIFDYAFFPKGKGAEQRTQQNTIILSLAKLLKSAQEEWNDTLPISDTAPYTFDTERETSVANLKSTLRMGDYATAENCIAAMIELYHLENYTAEEQRIAIGVQYEMELRQFTMKNPFVFSSDISRDTMYKIQENSQSLTGVDVQTTAVREYVGGTIGAHLIGTVGPIYAEEYKDLKDQGYQLNDTVGKSGIESAMESTLRGTTGTTTIVKDASGAIVNKTITLAPVQGNSVVLTLDSNLQKVAQTALDNKIIELKKVTKELSGADVRSGSVVVLDAKNGGVLACASSPGFDLSTYYEKYNELIADKSNPLFNRALNGTFAVGSTMKPVVALAALTENVITPSTTFTCNHTYLRFESGGYTPKCMGTHGNINIITALSKSCNIFFYETGYQLGIKRMNAYAAQFGLGQKTGIEVGEAVGVLAGPDHSASIGEVWTGGMTIAAAIGQDDNLFTPIQLAAYAMTLANDGVRFKTHLVQSIRTYDGKETLVEPEVAAEVELSKAAIDTVRAGMVQAATTGTARIFNNAGYTVAAKTGTAQVSNTRSDHGAFIAYAPVENPEIAIAVLMEDGTSSASTAVAKEVMDAYFASKSQGLSPTPEGKLLP